MLPNVTQPDENQPAKSNRNEDNDYSQNNCEQKEPWRTKSIPTWKDYVPYEWRTTPNLKGGENFMLNLYI